MICGCRMVVREIENKELVGEGSGEGSKNLSQIFLGPDHIPPASEMIGTE